jgi:hypothetical protein
MVDSRDCLLCGKPDDGVLHSLNCCEALKGMRIDRHNEAVGIMYRCIYRSALGSSLVMQDIGTDNAAGDLIAREEIRTRIPADVYMSSPHRTAVDTKEHWDRYRPDILQIHDNKAEGVKEIGIVEVKYCRDTDPRPQRAAALEQHSLLLADMKRLYPDELVQVLPITLGVTGTVYTDFYETMRLLGVSKAEAKDCARQLHVLAVRYVKKLMTTKWNRERHETKGVG